MTPVWFNRKFQDDAERRQRLYAGEIFVYDGLQTVKELAAFTAALVEAALAPHDPRSIHETLTPADLAPLLGKLKPQFIHHPESRRLVSRVIAELGGDLDDCYLDLPKLRTAYPSGHLTKGIAFAFAGHRDTWYGAPQAQINWWLPIYPLAADNAMSFYPRYFGKPVENDSIGFNYYQRNVERRSVVVFVDEDPRIQPSATNLNSDEAEVRLLPDVGGVILFSGAQLHATSTSATSRSRYSVDFRTVSCKDIEQGLGASNVDTKCFGTALRDFTRVRDGAEIADALVRKLDPEGPRPDQLAVYRPDA